MKRGLFLSLEGIDGAGKSTHLEFISEYLKSKGHQVIITREPGGTIIGEKIRELLLMSDQINHNTELLLYFASRQELISNVIIPNLKNGVSVIADRFVDASIAYQGGGRKLGVEKIRQVYNLLEPRLKTDITFLFDVPLKLAMNRLQRSRQLDRIEKEPEEFFSRVQNTYYQLANSEPERIKIIMTNREIEKTREEIICYLDVLLDKNN